MAGVNKLLWETPSRVDFMVFVRLLSNDGLIVKEDHVVDLE